MAHYLVEWKEGIIPPNKYEVNSKKDSLPLTSFDGSATLNGQIVRPFMMTLHAYPVDKLLKKKAQSTITFSVVLFVI